MSAAPHRQNQPLDDQNRKTMNLHRVLRCVLLATFFAALCVFASAAGALITFAAGSVALMVVSRSDSFGKSDISEYFPWLLCTFAFVVTTLVLSPFAELAAVPLPDSAALDRLRQPPSFLWLSMAR